MGSCGRRVVVAMSDEAPGAASMSSLQSRLFFPHTLELLLFGGVDWQLVLWATPCGLIARVCLFF